METSGEILTIAELATHLRVHPTTIYRLLREGRIPGFRVGSAWRFTRSAIERWERGQLNIMEEFEAVRPRQKRVRKSSV